MRSEIEQAVQLLQRGDDEALERAIVLVLRDMEGLNDEDVAEITGLRAGTVRVRLHRARLFVRKELMKSWKPRASHRIGSVVPHDTSPQERKPARCKAIFAELSNYL